MARIKDVLELPKDSVEPGTSPRVQAVEKVPDRNIYSPVLFSFGLLCILQVVLNVSLHWTLYTAGQTRTALKHQLRGIFCFYDDENGDNGLNLTAVTDTSREQLADVCPSVYYISSSMKTWRESRRDCLRRGADLLIINSKAEQKFAVQFKKIVWIGLTDAQKEGEWKWVDGTQPTTSFWIRGEPNNYRSNDEDCVEAKVFDLENSWNDKNCEHENFWICETNLQKAAGE